MLQDLLIYGSVLLYLPHLARLATSVEAYFEVSDIAAITI